MKLLPGQIVTSQLQTINNQQLIPNLTWLYVAPLIAGALAGRWGVPHLDISSLLAAVAVFTGLIFQLSFSVFDKSLQIQRDPLLAADPNVLSFVEQLRVNANYTVLVGIVLTAVLASATFFEFSPLAGVTTGVCAALTLHMLFMCLLLLKRFTDLHDAMKP